MGRSLGQTETKQLQNDITLLTHTHNAAVEVRIKEDTCGSVGEVLSEKNEKNMGMNR